MELTPSYSSDKDRGVDTNRVVHGLLGSVLNIKI